MYKTAIKPRSKSTLAVAIKSHLSEVHTRQSIGLTSRPPVRQHRPYYILVTHLNIPFIAHLGLTNVHSDTIIVLHSWFIEKSLFAQNFTNVTDWVWEPPSICTNAHKSFPSLGTVLYQYPVYVHVSARKPITFSSTRPFFLFYLPDPCFRLFPRGFPRHTTSYFSLHPTSWAIRKCRFCRRNTHESSMP